MTPEELLAAVEALDPADHDIAAALAFIRLVVENNPKKSAAEIFARPDIAEALAAIDGWIKAAVSAATAVVTEVPEAIPLIAPPMTDTLTKLEHDTRLDRIEEWRSSDQPAETWAAKIVLRMTWFQEWLHKMAEWALLGTPYKRWVSRLDPKTCKYCRALHGAVLPLGKSFAAEAMAVGFTRIYGGLFTPPLHPNCRCYLAPVTQAEFAGLADTSGES